MISALEPVAWPLAFIAVAIIAFAFFRIDFGRLLGRVGTARLPGGMELTFGQSNVDQRSREREQLDAAAVAPSVNWKNVGNLYWLAHDLMWSIDVTLRGAARSQLLIGISQSAHHAKEIGLTMTAKRLGRLHQAVELTDEGELLAGRRDEIASELARIRDQCGAIAEAAQPLFRSTPQQV